jgi:hypothetical protein
MDLSTADDVPIRYIKCTQSLIVLRRQLRFDRDGVHSASTLKLVSWNPSAAMLSILDVADAIRTNRNTAILRVRMYSGIVVSYGAEVVARFPSTCLRRYYLS